MIGGNVKNKMKKKLHVRFFEHKDGIPTNSDSLGDTDGTKDNTAITVAGLDDTIEDWMRNHLDGKIDFVWL